MPRIRSVHPGLFTDEAYLDASPLARLFFIGLWCEAHDDGVFEWKPRQLKVRLLPLDNTDAEELLAELQTLGFLHRYRFRGKDLGVIRKFQKWQSPQKAKPSNLLPPELIPFAASGGTWPVRVSDDYDNGTISIPSGEERRGEEGKGDSAGAECASGAAEADLDPDPKTDRVEVQPSPRRTEDLRDARWRDLVVGLPVLVDPDLTPIRGLLAEPSITESDVEIGIRSCAEKARRKPRCWADFEGWIRRAAKDRIAATPRYPGQADAGQQPPDPSKDRRNRLAKATAHFRGEWRQGWPAEMRPGDPACTTPPDVIEEARLAVERSGGVVTLSRSAA